MGRTVLAGVGVFMAALIAGGCASKPVASGTSPGQGALTTSSLSAPVKAKNDCTEFTTQVESPTYTGSRPTGGRLPDSAHPVSLLQCVQTYQDVPGQGQWEVVNTVRSTGSVDAFVSALRAAYVRPPEPTPQGEKYSCAAVGDVPPWLVLIDADGTAYQISIPFWGVCRAPDRNVTAALQAVPTTIAATERIKQMTSPGAQAGKCDQQFAEMAFVGAQASGSAASRPFFSGPNPDKSFRACYYKLGADADKQKPAGDFETSAMITGTQGAAVYDGLMNAALATGTKTCTAPANEYVVLFGNGGTGDWSVVELDGCMLAAPDGGPDRQIPEPVWEALVAAKKH